MQATLRREEVKAAESCAETWAEWEEIAPCYSTLLRILTQFGLLIKLPCLVLVALGWIIFSLPACFDSDNAENCRLTLRRLPFTCWTLNWSLPSTIRCVRLVRRILKLVLDPVPCRLPETVRMFGLSADKRPKGREKGMEPSPSFSQWGKRVLERWWGCGCVWGGEWIGPASDLRQKECPRLLSRPAPLAAISTGAFVFTFQTLNCGAEATEQLTAAPAAALHTVAPPFLSVWGLPHSQRLFESGFTHFFSFLQNADSSF